MFKRIVLILALIFMAHPAWAREPDFTPGRIIIELAPEPAGRAAPRERIAALTPGLRDSAITKVAYLAKPNVVQIDVRSGSSAENEKDAALRESLNNTFVVHYDHRTKDQTRALLDRLNAHDNVIFASPDHLCQVEDRDSGPGLTVSKHNRLSHMDDKLAPATDRSERWHHFPLETQAAWRYSTGRGVIVALVDTGIDYRHTNLQDAILKDGNGIIVGWDFGDNDPDTMENPDWYDGTVSAGVIAARRNGFGVVGIAPEVKIMPLKIMNSKNEQYESHVAQAIYYALDRFTPLPPHCPRDIRADIINISLGDYKSFPYIARSIDVAQRDGVLVTATAGNDRSDNDVRPFYPASCGNDNLIAVAGTNYQDELYDDGTQQGSNYGRTSVDISAPCLSIFTTLPNNSAAFVTGTSIAAPMAAGTLALIKSIHPTYSPRDLKTLLVETADMNDMLNGRLVWGGRINARKAVSALFVGAEPERHTFIDMNGDRMPDLVHVNGYPTGGITVVRNDGQGRLERTRYFEGLRNLGADPARQRFVDMNADGYPDLVHVCGGNGGILVHLNDRNGGLEPGPHWTGLPHIGTDPARQRFVDMNADGYPDLVHICGGNGGILVHLNDRTGGLETGHHWFGLTNVGTDPARQRFVDMNADGYPDLVHVCGEKGGILVHLNDQTGGLETGHHWFGLTNVGTDPARQRFVDMNADGYPDLAHLCGGDGGILIHLNDRTGGLEPGPHWFGLTNVGTNPARQRFRDMNADGYPDLVHVCGGQGGILIHLNDRTGGLEPGPHWVGLQHFKTEPGRQRFVDMDADGYTDIVHVSGGQGGLVTHLNDRTGVLQDAMFDFMKFTYGRE